MPAITEVISLMRKLAPEDTAEPWDNTGLLIGDENAGVNNVLIALDCTDEVIGQAVRQKAELIITHHSVIFKGITKINASTALGRRLLSLTKNGIAVYSSHTNLDIAENGTNDTLFQLLRLKNKKPLMVEDCAIGRIGYADKKYTLREFAEFTAQVLESEGVSFVGKPDAAVGKIGICTGGASGIKYMESAAAAGCDTYLTGDISYHNAQYAADLGLNLISAPHFSTEVLVTETLFKYLTEAAAASNMNVNFFISENQKDIFNYV